MTTPATLPRWLHLSPGKTPIAANRNLPGTGFLHMPKTGGTTLRQLVDSAGVPGVLFLGHPTRLQPVFAEHPRLRIVCTIRDPISRFVSGFYSRLRQGRPTRQAVWSPGEAAAFQWFGEAEALVRAFESPDDRLQSAAWFAKAEIKHLRWDYPHYFSSADFVRRHAHRFAFVSEIERLDENLPQMLAVLGVAQMPAQPEAALRRHVAPSHAGQVLSDAAKQILRRVLAADYEIYDALREIAQR